MLKMMGRRFVVAAAVAAVLLTPLAAGSSDVAGSYYHFSLAKLADFEMRYADAVAEFEKAIALDPDSARLHVELAGTLVKAGRVDQAIEQCQRAIELDPELSDPHFLLGQIYKSSLDTDAADGKIEKAIKEFKRAVELDQSNQEALFYLGQLLYYNDDYQEAAAIFGRFLQLRSNIPKAYNYRASALLKLGEVQGAIEVLEDSLRADPDNLDNLQLLGQLYDKTDQDAKAADTYLHAVAVAPTTEFKFRAGMALMRLERFSEAVPLFRDVVSEAPADMGSRVELGKALEGAGSFAEAVEAFKQVLESEPKNVEAIYYLASSLRALGRRPEAIERVKGLLKLMESMSPKNPEQAAQFETRFKSFLGILYQESRQYDQALAIFREIAERNPDDYRAQLGLIYALKDAGQLQEALRLSADLAEAQPKDKDVLITRARILSLSGQLESAVSLLQEQISGTPPRDDVEDLYLAVCQLFSEHKMYARAERVVRKAIEELPPSERLQFQLGALLERQNKPEEAEAAFKGILESNPRHSAVLNYLGYMLADRGVRLQEALGYIERALDIEPHNGAYLDSLGWVYFKLDRLDRAESNLVEAARINDSDSTIYEHLGDLYYKTGEYAKARSYYERSVHFSDDPVERKKVEGKLASLNKLLAPEQQ